MASEQKTLFDKEIPPWEADAEAEHYVAKVVLPSGPTTELDYVVPDELRGSVVVGGRLLVPLGRSNREVTGYCIGLQNVPQSARRLKAVKDVVDGRPLLSPAMLRVTEWMADYYLCPLGQVLETVIPAGVRGKAGTKLTTLLSVTPQIIQRREELKLPKKQAAVLDYLAAHGGPMAPNELAAAAGCTQAPITALRRKGLITSEVRRMLKADAEPEIEASQPDLELNVDQKVALKDIVTALRRQHHETILVHGVTGSGKTEVYIQAIREVVSYGRQAIVLVPEISLTPQTVARFRSRFGRVAVLHSHLSDVDRHAYWAQIAEGSVPVVVGARSAVFAPTPHLGLIVIDEEHEPSFKQETAPRYHARDVARRRAIDEQVPLVLGSATPSLESYFKAQEGEYRLVRMPKRVFDRPLPAVATIDLRTESRDRHTRGAITRQLHTAIDAALHEGGQVILFLNRRGFSTHIQCPACGEPIICPDCAIALTHHKHGHQAICHYCDHQQDVPDRCPHCNRIGMRFVGRGTQRLEDEIRARFRGFECLRMDTDSMQRAGSHEAALARFRAGEVKILLGTQMIAKGLDFPEVTLVGVIDADTALHLPDFRAAERAFQLVTQVAGRTGRGDRGGRVIVQTSQPDHVAIRAATKHDYDSFASQELPIRKILGYPPYGSMVRIIVRGPIEAAASEFAQVVVQEIGAAAERHGTPIRIVGPAEAPFAKLRGKYRFAIQLQGPTTDPLRAAVRAAADVLKPPTDIQWIVDVDPLDML